MYWDRKPYKAFGLGACEFDGIVRSQNEKSLKMYMESIEQGKEVTIFSEILTTEQVYLEKIMLGLRRAQGVTLAAMSEGLSSIQVQHIIEKIAWLKQHDFIVEKDQALVLTPKGLAVENDIIVKLSL
jgi:oxygen-independent coproporphyrinogen-3 oxidase